MDGHDFPALHLQHLSLTRVFLQICSLLLELSEDPYLFSCRHSELLHMKSKR